ncbi:hypothetical protein FALBO_17270 [Fusarium albosuccineum]|uniref:HNH nuclease domain-containing protein n=1 Tax=Fusarium albosuccineum TaxID=1237068 RepID=A0A8H4K3Z1_9HYPO|nr:hypothetical protein FALBO_17270 [Fusarium albosuccineum]
MLAASPVFAFWNDFVMAGDVTGWFLQTKQYDAVQSRGSQTSGKASGKTVEKARDQNQRPDCLTLDYHRCIVTGARNPQVCHIVPFAWNKTEFNRKKTERLIPALQLVVDMPDDVETTHTLDTLHTGLGTSDNVSDMVALSPLLHYWWARGCFAFKYLGTIPITPGPDGES